MDNLFDPAVRDRILARFEALRPDAEKQWGTMDAGRMVAHCALTMEAATGDRPVKRGLMARILGPLFKGAILGPKPFGRDAPTHPDFRVPGPMDIGKERERLVAVIRKFVAAGPAAAARQEHGFVGKITGDEWGVLMAKHLDHHLNQFGG